MEGLGEKKLHLPILKSGKRQKSLLGRSVSTHFVADCSFTRILRRVFGGGNVDGGSLGWGGGGGGGKPSLLPFLREKPWASLKQGLV